MADKLTFTLDTGDGEAKDVVIKLRPDLADRLQIRRNCRRSTHGANGGSRCGRGSRTR